MDDAARLVSELHHKLAELDGKVAAYQRDMLTEFHKHMDECLRKYPDHVSKQVSRAIAESMSTGRYPALSPSARPAPPDLPATSHSTSGRKSPPPVLRHTSGTPKEEPRSPHAREKEFQGLFTPTYLPLLESRGPAETSPPMSPPPPPTSEGPLPALSAENVKKAEEPKQALPPRLEGRPVAARRLTDQSTSSASSSGSDSKARRSALRRSSSANKSSPRRVRFEFEGEEVFPASCVSQVPTVTLAVESVAEPEPEPETETPALATKDESIAYHGTSLLDVDGDEDFSPRPRKVSSTQALQALTRSPLEEGSVWTVVDSRNEELDKMNGANQPVTRDLPTRVDSQATIQANDAEEEPGDGQLGTPIEEQANYDEYDNASDEDVLSMRPKGKAPSPATLKSPFARPPIRPAAVSTAPERNGHPDIDEDDDPFFDLDDEGVQPSPRSKQSPQKYLPDPLSDDEDTTPGRVREAARDEARQVQSSSKIPPASPSAVLFGHSIGSYMGRSMTINPIKDPKLYDEIAGMKDVQFFVGSMNDCTEAEAAAMGSYRVGASSLARNARVDLAPRSFSERLALEEEMERRAEAGEGGF
jgi:hypothetical protein